MPATIRVSSCFDRAHPSESGCGATPPPPQPPGEDHVRMTPPITSCIVASVSEGAVRLFAAAAIKKLRAQEVSLFCVSF
jgi:hypothetical protein